jgi:hypothetical protein
MLEDLQLALEIVGVEEATTWCEEEWGDIGLGDERLDVRLIDTATKLAAQPTAPINQACEDWADTKASYRMFQNEKVTAGKILSPHQGRTQARMEGHRLVLAVQDTTYLNFTSHPKTTGLGPIGTREQQQQGLVMHTTLAMTPAGLPVGLLSQEIWVRAEEDEGLTEAERKRRPIEEKESYKWLKALEETVALTPSGVQVVTVCDREGDVYELFVQAQALETGLLVRAAQDRTLVDDEMGKLWDSVVAASVAGHLKVDVPAKDNEPARQAIVAVHFCSVTLNPPWRPQRPDQDPLPCTCRTGQVPAVTLDAVLVQEVDPPAGVTPLEWLLLTNVAVNSFDDALQRVRWYRCRWHIEVYHKVLKSGCKVEDCRLGTADRLIRYLTLSSIIAWRLYWLTHMNRHHADAPCIVVLTDHEWRALYAAIHHTAVPPPHMPTVGQVVRWIAQMGGFLARKSDGEPGPTVIWRGWHRLNDLAAMWLLCHPSTMPATYG